MSILDFLFGGANNSDAIEVLGKEDYKKAITKGKIQLVDVRTAREFAAGHIKGACNIDYFNPSAFKADFAEMKKDKPVYLYCQSGNRSQKAAKKLVGMGFSMIYDLKGGYRTWNY
ncbi:rhodanese-like domain-containing protein [Flagellimonas pacifica]|uniref:Rhodanese-related sulfurtransferase n=1 Tax=Flagellimonas pacifica TaxID=1247520 RepID=A0A285MF06_9FLAO|nr:rhodanese-like domain-containing protein [Allomuricauda parva]SNY95303.1 Rhodanese-related sulfurtransferase [Allomuricauda parva]